MPQALCVDLHKLAHCTNAALFALPALVFAFGQFVLFYFHFLTGAAFFPLGVNLFYQHIQNEHTILRNFGLIGQGAGNPN